MVAQTSRTVSPLSAALLDLDHFKRINDAYGHSRGDEVLAAVAMVLRSSVRESDFVGRYGGEEFLLLLPDTGRDQAAIVAEKVRAAVAGLGLSEINQPVTASWGWPPSPTTRPTPTRSSAPPTGPSTPPKGTDATGSSCSSPRPGSGPSHAGQATRAGCWARRRP
jgi:GGDEF domain-containing protein